MNADRRKVILGGLAATAMAGCHARVSPEINSVLPVEDLMREHGVLRRVLLIYDEVVLKIDTAQDLSPDVLPRAARIVRDFIEDYHERLEEDRVFPRFERARRYTDLTDALREQHRTGRRLTAEIAMTTRATLEDDAACARLCSRIREFRHMYDVHAAREDTVLFPALHDLVTPTEYDAMGEDFENEERRRFGNDGFEAMVEHVAALEWDIGIGELRRVTPV
jgi:hemerythrin-like domain-containing protein